MLVVGRWFERFPSHGTFTRVRGMYVRVFTQIRSPLSPRDPIFVLAGIRERKTYNSREVPAKLTPRGGWHASFRPHGAVMAVFHCNAFSWVLRMCTFCFLHEFGRCFRRDRIVV